MITLPVPFDSATPAISVHSNRHFIAPIISEASRRFGIPEAWIYAIIDVESHDNPAARSRAGALGLMQLMPATWRSLRVDLGLGNGPLDPHDNIIAGTAYLRSLFDRYGVDGVFAAYNAGPGRYEDSILSGKPLPNETVAYVALLARRLQQISDQPATLSPLAKRVSWPVSPIFVDVTSSASPPPRAAQTLADNAMFVTPSTSHDVPVPSP